MTDKFLHHRPGRLSDDRFDLVPSGDGNAVDDFHSFGWLRGVRERAPMLELRKKSGNVIAIGYSWIGRVEFEPSEGIILHAHDEKIRIIGRNLNAEVRPEIRLFHGITRHRVAWIRESDNRSSLKSGEHLVIIDEIAW